MFDSSKYQKTWADIKQYALTQFDLLKVGFLEKAAKIAGLIVFALALVLLLFAIVSFGCLSLMYAISQTLPLWASALIVVALWLLIMIGVIIFRKQLFINPMLVAICGILFAPTENNQQPKANGQQLAEREEVHHE